MDFGQRPATLQAHLPQLAAALEWAAAFIEACAIAILILGFLRFFYHFARAELRQAPKVEGTSEIAAARIVLAHYILSALEVFIVADLIMLVLSLSMESLLFLAVLVLVRTGISYFLEHEIRALEARNGT
jgi:uncharacterized membrane protein